MKKLFILAAAVMAVTGCFFNPKAPEIRYSTDLIPVNDGGEYYYIDVKTGKKAPGCPVFDAADYFFDGVARVKRDGEDLYTLIDKDFKAISNEEYVDATSFHDGIAFVVRPKSHIEAIDKKGKVLFELDLYDKAYSYNYGYAVVEKDGKCGVIDKTGKLVIDTDYQYITLCQKYIVASKERNDETRYGVIDYNGKEILPFNYDAIYVDQTLADRGLFIAEKNDKCGVVNDKDEEIISREWYYIRFVAATGNFLCYKSTDNGNYKVVMVNKKGEEVSDRITVDTILGFGFSKATAATRDNNSDHAWGLLDTKLEWIVNPKWYDGNSFNDDGLSIFAPESAEFGAVNDKGEVVIRPRYTQMYYFGGGLYNVYDGSEEGMINSKGETVIRFNSWDFPYPSESTYVESAFVDVERVATAVVNFINRLVVSDISFSTYQSTFDVDLETYGWETLARLDYPLAGGALKARCDWGYDHSFDRRYYITSFQAHMYTLGTADNCCDEVWQAVVNRLSPTGDIHNLYLQGMPDDWTVSARAENDYFYLEVNPHGNIY